jgi:hypothetical protein
MPPLHSTHFTFAPNSLPATFSGTYKFWLDGSRHSGQSLALQLTSLVLIELFALALAVYYSLV